MPFDIIGFGEAAPGANGKLAALLGDSLYDTSGDDLTVKESAPFLLGVFSWMESTGDLIKIQQPSLPQDYEITKNALGANVTPSLGYTHLFDRPLPLVAGEKLNVEVVNATDEDAIVFLLLGSGRIPPSSLGVNPTHIIQGEGDDTMVAFTWRAMTMTWSQTLPKGDYVPVGLTAGYWKTAAPTMPAAIRLRFKSGDAASWAPGVPGCYMDKAHLELQTLDYFPPVDWPFMDNLKFTNKSLPTIEACSAETATDITIQLMLQKVG